MLLLPTDIKIPPLYGQDGLGLNATVYAKVFAPWASATWFLLERENDTLFTWADLGQGGEFGYASLAELEALRGPLGLRLERDLYWEPKRLRDAIADQSAYR